MVFPLVKDTSAKELEEDYKNGTLSERKTDVFITKELVLYIDAHYLTQKKTGITLYRRVLQERNSCSPYRI